MKEGGGRRTKITDFPLMMHRGVVALQSPAAFCVTVCVQTRPADGMDALRWLEGRDQPLPEMTKMVFPQC